MAILARYQGVFGSGRASMYPIKFMPVRMHRVNRNGSNHPKCIGLLENESNDSKCIGSIERKIELLMILQVSTYFC